MLAVLCELPSAVARPRAAAPARVPAPAAAKPSPVADCAVWPPKVFPKVGGLYELKLEYDCRNRTIAHQRYLLTGQETLKSIELAEKHDQQKIVEKDKWIEQVQSDLAAHQRELDRWRDETIARLTLARREGGDSGSGVVKVVNVSAATGAQ